MTTQVIRPQRPATGLHSVARPLPPPPRVRSASEESHRDLDALGRELEQWIRDLPVRSTEAGD